MTNKPRRMPRFGEIVFIEKFTYGNKEGSGFWAVCVEKKLRNDELYFFFDPLEPVEHISDLRHDELDADWDSDDRWRYVRPHQIPDHILVEKTRRELMGEIVEREA